MKQPEAEIPVRKGNRRRVMDVERARPIVHGALPYLGHRASPKQERRRQAAARQSHPRTCHIPRFRRGPSASRDLLVHDAPRRRLRCTHVATRDDVKTGQRTRSARGSTRRSR